ncbi:MAG: YfhO family protein [Salibacteraceae bacterium]
MNINSLRPHLIVASIFVAITLAYFMPVLKGKNLAQHDVVQAHAMAKEVTDYHKETGKYSLWTGRMFGGMPVYQIWAGSNYNPYTMVWRAYHDVFKSPIDIVLIYLFGFYMFMLILGFSPTLSALGAIAFSFSSYNFIIIEAGHLAKAMALGFAPLILGGIHLVLKEKYIKGAALIAVSVGFHIMSNHIQITYYLFFVIAFWLVFEIIEGAKSKTFPKLGKQLSIMLIAAIIGLLPNLTKILSTKDYVEETIRGKQELSTKQVKGDGLSKSYATNWSYGKLETMTLMFPNFMGGASGGSLSEDSKTYEALIDRGIGKKQAQGFIKSMPLYWGPQQFISGPIYFGALIILLSIFGLFLSKDKSRWWLLGATVFCILIAWGRNLDWFYSIFFNYLPLFNKFRSPSMILAVANISTIWLAIIGLKAILDTDKKDLLKIMKIGGAVGGFALVMALLGSSMIDFDSQYVVDGVSSDDRFEQQMVQMSKSKDFGATLMQGIIDDRSSIMMKDAFRSFGIILLGMVLILLFLKGKVKQEFLVLALATVTLIDLWSIDKKYLNADDFTRKKDISKNFSLSEAERSMLQDTDPNYRVLNTTVNIFNDASPAYFYKTIGGYHAAKLKRYQDLIEVHISRELGKLNEGFENTPILNMLNMKYVVFGKAANQVALNNSSLGNAWFVDNVSEVNNADEEIATLGTIDVKNTIVVDKQFKEYYSTFTPGSDNSGAIKLTSYDPQELTYEFNSTEDELTVFSEIYYHGNKDWIAYVDGEEKDHFRVNYVLRGMVIPKGKHEIKFVFKPQAYYLGEKLAIAGSTLLFVLLGLFGFKIVKSRKEDG